MDETWKPVPSLPGVEASSLGHIRQTPRTGPMPSGGVRVYGGKVRRGTWDGTRYVMTIRRRSHKVARLVCEAFNGAPPPGKPLCMHLDENSRNNRPENLAWGTSKENSNFPGFLQIARNRAWLKNRKIGRKVTVDDARHIRTDPRPHKQIADGFGISVSMVGHIKYGRAWKHA